MIVLLTSAGRRTSLLQHFQNCVHERGGRVWASDLDSLAPTLRIADDTVVLPPVDEDSYIPTLLDLVQEHDIDLVVPLIDPGLRPLATAREAFADIGCRALVSSPSFLDAVLDKWATVQYFSARGIRTPKSWLPESSDPDAWPDPVFVKPRRGSASNSARRVSRDHVLHVLESTDEPIVQEVVEAPEITVDALFDFDGTLLHYVPRRRVRTMAGESIQGRTLPDAEVASWLRPVLREAGRLGARGPLTLQAFLTTPEPTLSEINARFGGGFPLAHAAGGHYPEWIVQLCTGASVEPRLGDYETDLCMTRAYTEWFVEADALTESSEDLGMSGA
jgi:carbamoyl-phosphate synthase large subunit